MKEQGVPPTDPKYMKAAQLILNFERQFNMQQNQHQDVQSRYQTQQIAEDDEDAKSDLNTVNEITEQETLDNSHRTVEEDYRYTTLQEDMESELLVVREMYKALEEESSAEIEHAAKNTQLKLEAQTLAQTLAQEIALHKSSVEELKGQFLRATQRPDKDEKANAWMNKIRSFRFPELRNMIIEIQKKREARETPEAPEARQARQACEAQEARILRHIADANFELSDHKERKQRIIERREKALEAMHADGRQEDSSAAPGELEARDPPTEVPLRTETSESELKFYRESISAEEEKIGDILEKIEALEEELRLFRAENEVQVPSDSENQKTKSRDSLKAIWLWQCVRLEINVVLGVSLYIRKLLTYILLV